MSNLNDIKPKLQTTNRPWLKRLLPYAICLLLGTIIAVGIVCGNKIWELGSLEKIRLLSDAFLVPGVCLAGIGLLVLVSRGGVFDMLSFAIIRLFDLFRKDCRNPKYKDFYEYRQAKKGNKRPIAFMLIVGVGFLLMSIVFTAIWASKQ